MVKFRFASRKNSHVPFPSLVSVILFYHRIWFLGPPDSIRTPPPFGKIQLNYMKLTFEDEASGQSRAPSRSRASHARASQAQEAQSAPQTSQSSLPSDFGSRVKAIVDAAIASLSIRLEFEIGKLVKEVTRGNNEMVDAQEQMRNEMDEVKSKVEDVTGHFEDLDARLTTMMVSNVSLSDKVDKILQHFHIGSSSAFGSAGPSSSHFEFQSPAEPKPEPEPSQSPHFHFTTPSIPTSSCPTPTTEVLHTPAHEPLNIPPSPASTVRIESPPPTPLITPLDDSEISAPPPFEDDKGGEKDQV